MEDITKIVNHSEESVNQKDLTIENEIAKINERIEKEYDKETENQLKDSNMLDLYKKSKSTQRQIYILKQILISEDIGNNKINSIIDKYILNLISPGTKGVLRGIKFNEFVKNKIYELQLNDKIFDIQFEKVPNNKVIGNNEKFKISERPDWFIYDKINNKILIGMNQIDLWGGGHQLNRGYKYIINNVTNTNNCNLICVICKHIKIKSKNKVYHLFKEGFKNNTLCYINNLHNVINQYFESSKLID